MKIKVAIAGGTGYTGGELIRLLLRHPNAEIVSVLSTTSIGVKVSDIHRDLIGDTDLVCSERLDFGANAPDVLFLCLGHGLSREFLSKTALPEKCKIIDLGNDFRVDNSFERGNFVYGLCELNREIIGKSNYVANPGCFATAIQLALLPLASRNLIIDDVHIHAITGSTGAGKKLTDTSHFSYRDSNIAVYKPFTHQHLDEIRNTVGHLQKKLTHINFIPMRGDFARGIFASLYTKASSDDLSEITFLYDSFYQSSSFVHISREPISLKEVVNTNKSLVHVELHDGFIYITSIIDNLIKGASGQAIQNMNIMFGLNETDGLLLKPSAF